MLKHAGVREGGKIVEDALGFRPVFLDPPPAQDSVRTALFRARRQLVGLVFYAAQLEGSPYTFPEVQTLLDGITVGGHRLEDERLILNLKSAWKTLFEWVAGSTLWLDKGIFCALHAQVGFEEALTWGAFRDGPVSIPGTIHRPPPPEELDGIFQRETAVLAAMEHPYHRTINFFLFGSLHQFFYDANKRTSRLMASGILLENRYDLLNIPAAHRLEFNQRMVEFYDSRDGRTMGEFLGRLARES